MPPVRLRRRGFAEGWQMRWAAKQPKYAVGDVRVRRIFAWHPLTVCNRIGTVIWVWWEYVWLVERLAHDPHDGLIWEQIEIYDYVPTNKHPEALS